MQKRMIREWLENRTDNELFNDSVGNTPSLKDIIKMVHPRPNTKAREAFYAYLIDKDPKNPEVLPEAVKNFERFKALPKGTREIPPVNFQMLTALDLSEKEWVELSKSMKWHALRMNINTLERHGVLKDMAMVNSIAARLEDKEVVRKAKVFPYQLFTAYTNVEPSIPIKIINALQKAMEAATTNIPKLKGKIVVAVDCSGSMDAPVTGNRGSVSTKTTCKQVASLIAACILRNSDKVDVLRFTTSSERIHLNPDDSVMKNTKAIGTINGGTAVSSPVAQLNDENAMADAIIILSDNESWADGGYRSNGSPLMVEWHKFKKRNPNAKLVCVDLAPNAHTQACSGADRLNIGGMTDNVFTVIDSFINGNGSVNHWVDAINQVTL
jgi:60 kDa SS-A/Ro ribonucleoprotein